MTDLYFFTILEAGELKIKVSAVLVSPGATFLGQGTAVFSMSPHGHSSGCICVLISSSYKDVSHIRSGPKLMIFLYLNYFFKDPSLNTVTFWRLGFRTPTWIWGEDSSVHDTNLEGHYKCTCIKLFSEFNNICSFWTTPVHTYPLYLLTPTLEWISKDPASFRSLSQGWASTVPDVGSEPPNPTWPAPSSTQGDGKHCPARATLRHVSATVFLCGALRMDPNHTMESLPGRLGT